MMMNINGGNIWFSDPRYIDPYTREPIKRTPESHRYNYDTFVQWELDCGETKATSSADSDRMRQWDWDKNERCTKEVWGNVGQMFYSYMRSPEDIEKYLQLYFDEPKLKLVHIYQWCNQASGYPGWNFGWIVEK